MNQEDSNYLSGGLSGAASGAAAGTAIAPGWGTLIGGVVGAGVGLYGAYQQNEAMDNRPKYEIPSEVRQNLNEARQRSLQGLPEVQKQQYLQNIQRGQSSGLRALGERKAGLLGVAGMGQQNIDAATNLAVMDAQARERNYGNLVGARNQMADYKGQAFQFNRVNPYYENIASQQAYTGAALGSINNAANTLGNYYQNQRSMNTMNNISANNAQSAQFNQYNAPIGAGMYNYNPYSTSGTIAPDYNTQFTS